MATEPGRVQPGETVAHMSTTNPSEPKPRTRAAAIRASSSTSSTRTPPRCHPGRCVAVRRVSSGLSLLSVRRGHDEVMSFWSTHPKTRWIAPVAAVAAIAVTPYAVNASADSGLPARTVDQLLSDVQHSDVATLSGTIVESANLGLPSLPGIGGSNGSSDLTALVSGSHTLRLWVDGPDKQRLAVVGSRGESDIIRNGRTLWTWSSDTKTATKTTLPADSSPAKTPTKLPALGSLPTALPNTPADAAASLYKSIASATNVTTTGTATVAGRAATSWSSPRRRRPPRAWPRSGSRSTAPSMCRCGCRSTRPSWPSRRSRSGSPRSTSARRTPASSPSPRRPARPSRTARRPRHDTKIPDAIKAPEQATAATKPTVVGTGWATVVVDKLPG